jgi:DNA polymerase-3 subunit epsilon
LFKVIPNDRRLGFAHERHGRLLGSSGGCGMSKPLASVRLVALDFETAVSMDHAIEIGCAEIIGGRLTGKVFHQLVRPLVPINPFTEAVHGISEKKVALMPTFAQVADTFLNFIGDAGIVAHGEHVERTILAKELARLGRQPLNPQRFICTLALARRSELFARNGLRDVCRDLNIRCESLRAGHHDAVGDARMAAMVYLRLTGQAIPQA